MNGSKEEKKKKRKLLSKSVNLASKPFIHPTISHLHTDQRKNQEEQQHGGQPRVLGVSYVVQLSLMIK
jgi:hypothetical protein